MKNIIKKGHINRNACKSEVYIVSVQEQGEMGMDANSETHLFSTSIGAMNKFNKLVAEYKKQLKVDREEAGGSNDDDTMESNYRTGQFYSYIASPESRYSVSVFKQKVQ